MIILALADGSDIPGAFRRHHRSQLVFKTASMLCEKIGVSDLDVEGEGRFVLALSEGRWCQRTQLLFSEQLFEASRVVRRGDFSSLHACMQNVPPCFRQIQTLIDIEV